MWHTLYSAGLGSSALADTRISCSVTWHSTSAQDLLTALFLLSFYLLSHEWMDGWSDPGVILI